jgi:DNA-binding response OmpR family regulator
MWDTASMSNVCKILIVDDEDLLLNSLAEMLKDCYEVSIAEDLDRAKKQLLVHNIDIILLDIRLANGTSGLELIPFAQELCPAPSVVLMSAFIDKPIAIQATNNGVLGILEKPFEPSEVFDHLQRLIKRLGIDKKSELQACNLALDSKNFRLKTKNKSLSLTKTEYQILSLLMNKPNQWVQRDLIESQIWPGVQVSRNTLDTHFSNLKKRIPELRPCFESRRGFGIRFIQLEPLESPTRT